MITANDIIQKLKEGKLDSPGELSDYLVKLSAYLFDAAEYETEAEIEYMKKWAEIKANEHTDKLTDALTKQTEEYRLYKKMKNSKDSITEVIRALKHKLKNLQTELSEFQNY